MSLANMRDTCTIYYDEHNGVHHTLVCSVEEGRPHKVVMSEIDVNTSPLSTLVASAVKVFGEENVRAYIVLEYRKP